MLMSLRLSNDLFHGIPHLRNRVNEAAIAQGLQLESLTRSESRYVLRELVVEALTLNNLKIVAFDVNFVRVRNAPLNHEDSDIYMFRDGAHSFIMQNKVVNLVPKIVRKTSLGGMIISVRKLLNRA